MKFTQSKGKRLLNAVLWTVAAAATLCLVGRGWNDFVAEGVWPMYVLLVLIQVTAAAISWYDYLAYDKKKKS